MPRRLTPLLLAGAVALSCSVALDFDRSYPQREASLIGVLDIMPPAGDHEQPDSSLCPDFCEDFMECMGESCHLMTIVDGEVARRTLDDCIRDCERKGTLVHSHTEWIHDHCAEASELYMAENPQWTRECDVFVQECETLCENRGFSICTRLEGECMATCLEMPFSFWVCARAEMDQGTRPCRALGTCRTLVEPDEPDERDARDDHGGPRPRDPVGDRADD